jgi:hypothetical protein
MTDSRDHPTGVIGLAWFRKEDYPSLLAIFDDAHEMHETWEEWEESAKKVAERLKTEGRIIERVYIDPDTFPGWCREAGVKITGAARSKFAAQTVAKLHRNRE